MFRPVACDGFDVEKNPVLQTTAIRPAEAKATYRRMFEAEVARFCDAGGKLAADFAVETACPLCDSSDATPFDPDRDSSYQRCTACGCVYPHPRPSDVVIDDFARHSPALRFFHEHILLATESVRRDGVFQPLLELITERVAPGGRVLELGCAVGTFLQLLSDAGYRAEGIELCDYSVAHCESLGHTIHDQPIEKCELTAGSFDAVCAWGVFGHLQYAQRSVRAMYDALKPGGKLIFTATNIQSFEYMTLKSRAMNPFLRYVYYTPENIRELLTRIGFVDIAVSTPGETDVQTVRETLGQPDPALGDFLNSVLFDEGASADAQRASLQRWIASENRSGYMLVAASKPA